VVNIERGKTISAASAKAIAKKMKQGDSKSCQPGMWPYHIISGANSISVSMKSMTPPRTLPTGINNRGKQIRLTSWALLTSLLLA